MWHSRNKTDILISLKNLYLFLAVEKCLKTCFENSLIRWWSLASLIIRLQWASQNFATFRIRCNFGRLVLEASFYRLNFQRQDEEDARTVYVRNLHPKINEQQLREHFSMFGAIKRIVLPQDAHQIGSNRGFTFITFASKEPVEVACSLGKDFWTSKIY